MMNRKYLWFYWILAAMLSGCSNTRFLSDGERLYTGGKIILQSDSMPKSKQNQLTEKLNELLRPKANSSFLGLRPKLYIYQIIGKPKQEKGIRHWLRTKIGEAPVLFSMVDLDHNSRIINNYLENRGFFNVSTTAESALKKKKARAVYTVTPGFQYRISTVNFPNDSAEISKAIYKTKAYSLLKPGNVYDLETIKGERVRIDAFLKETGYYFFTPDILIVQLDSTVGRHQISLNLKVKNDTPKQALKSYRIANILVYPNYTIRQDTVPSSVDEAYRFDNIYIFDPGHTFKRQLFSRSLLFKMDSLYNRTDHNKSLNRLLNLGVFKFSTNQFKINDHFRDRLDACYYLTPFSKKSIRLELLGKTTSVNFAGSEINANWLNRNTFKGAEQLTISFSGGFDVQISGQNKGSNVYRFGSEASLVWPKLLVPFYTKSTTAYIPRTKAMIGYESQSRINLYTLNSFKASFGYLWKENAHKDHALTIASINYVKPLSISREYQQQIDLYPVLGRVIEQQLIFGPNYTYTYTNTMDQNRKNTLYFLGNIDAAGNVAGLLTGAGSEKRKEFFGVPFSQYIKLETDFRHYLRFGKRSRFANRIIVGIGIPYGNSDQLPFTRQFYSGGTNSIRAFRARSIGPGSYNQGTGTSTFLPDESGDLKLEMNTELRTKLFSILNGALFADAGNVWLMNKSEDKPGGAFSKSFLNELAIGVGAGLRFDLSFLILRTDLAFPIRNPMLAKDNRWLLKQIDFGSSIWRRNNLVFNLAIGYPF